MPCARVCGMANMGNVGGRAEMDGAVLSPHLCPAAQCQGRTSPDPSGVRPVPSHSCCCQERGHRLVKEEVILEGGRIRGLTQAAWLEPGHPHWFQYSMSHWSHLPCRFTTALPVRAGALAFLAQEAEGCWCTAHPVPGAGEAPAECHKPAFLWAWAGKWGQESEVAMSCWG